MTSDDANGSIPAETSPLLITKKELAKRYSVSTRTVQTWVTRRIIPYIRMSRGSGRNLLLFNPKACDAALSRFGGVKELPVSWTQPRRKPLTKAVPGAKRTGAQAAASKLT